MIKKKKKNIYNIHQQLFSNFHKKKKKLKNERKREKYKKQNKAFFAYMYNLPLKRGQTTRMKIKTV